MKKKIIVIAIIVILLSSISIVSAGKNDINNKTKKKLKYEHRWSHYQIYFSFLRNASFEYGPNFLGRIKESGNNIQFNGCFFNVKITGVIHKSITISFLPLLPFRTRKYLEQDDLGIEIGDYIEITCKFFKTGAWKGYISEKGYLLTNGFALNVNLKVFELESQ